MKRHLMATFRFILDASKGYTLLLILSALAAALITPMQLMVTQWTFRIATKEIVVSVYGIVAVAAVWALARLLQVAASNAVQYSTQGLSLAVETQWTQRLMTTLGQGRYVLYDDPAFFEKLQLAQQQTAKVFTDAFTATVNIVTSIVGLILVSAVLFQFSPWTVVLSVASCIPGFIYQNWFGKKNWAFNKDMQPDMRKINYIAAVCMDPASAKENRLLRLGGWLQGQMNGRMGDYTDTIRAFNRKHLPWGIGGALTHAVGICAVIAWVYIAAAKGNISIADAVVYGSASTSTYTYVQWIVVYLDILITSLRGCGHDLELLSMIKQEDKVSAEVSEDTQEAIRFEHVCYTYHGCTEPALEDISFSIKRGERIAIVGENGAGKSTLVMLITGIYQPSQGQVYVESHDRFSNFLQDFKVFSFTIQDNIHFGAIQKPLDAPRLLQAATESGVTQLLEKYDLKMEDYIDRDYADEGYKFSGGERSKIAIARAFYANGEIVVMDEPSAALDVFAEKEIFERLAHLTDARTSIYITHRLANVLLADRIFMLEDGRLIAMGSHEELMQTCTEYKTLYKSQADLYVKA